MRTTLLALALLATTPMAASSSYLAALPVGRMTVDVMKTVTAPSSADLMAKQHAALTTRPDRWQVNSQGVAEEREAWEQRLAMTDPRNFTPEEQSDLRRPHDLLLEKTGEAVIELVPTPDGRMMLQADASLPELSGIILDVVNDTVETPFGRTNGTAEVASGADRFAPGAWSGTQWQLDAPGASVKFAIGRLADDRVILNYAAKQDGQMPRRVNCTIVFSGR